MENVAPMIQGNLRKHVPYMYVLMFAWVTTIYIVAFETSGWLGLMVHNKPI